MEIEVIKYRPIDKGFLKGFISIYIPKWDFEIHSLQLFEKSGRRWLSFPSRSYEDQGETKYFPFMRFKSKEITEKFNQKVLEALSKYLRMHENEHTRKLTPNDHSDKFFQEDEDIPF